MKAAALFLIGAWAAVVLGGCDFQVFRSEFADVVYSLPEVTDKSVRLDDAGRFTDEAARVRSDFVSGSAGDLNGDGHIDGVAVLATNTGGSGTFYTVHAILGDANGGYTDAASALLGDRIALSGVTVSGATIEVSILDRAPDEPFITEPHIPAVVRLTLEDEAWVEVTPTG